MEVFVEGTMGGFGWYVRLTVGLAAALPLWLGGCSCGHEIAKRSPPTAPLVCPSNESWVPSNVIVLLCDRMNRILEVDPDNMMVVVEPGVVTNDINDQLRDHGLFYAGYPMSLETCYIGGNVCVLPARL